MNILVLTYNFGRTSSGRTTYRVVKGLHELGVKIIVICANDYTEYNEFSVITINPKPFRPSRLFNLIGNIFGVELNYIFWEFRALKYCKTLIKSFKPDIIYSRGSPIASMTVGHRLSKKNDIPLFLHFADPIPAPRDWIQGSLRRSKLINTIKPCIKEANLISFVTEQMLSFQSSLVGDFENKNVFVSPNPIQKYNRLEKVQSEKVVFLFLGSLTKERRPHYILKQFIRATVNCPEFEFHIYGSGNDKNISAELLTSQNIKVFKETNDIQTVIKNSSVLVDIDSDSTNQVFLSGKLMEYLSYDKIILSITNPGSPASNILKKCSETSIISDFNTETLITSFKNAGELSKFELNYTERNNLRESLSIENICSNILDNINNTINEG